MKDFVRFEIVARDRVGMALDILIKLYEKNISIHSLEVFPEKVYIKIEKIDKDKKVSLVENIFSIEGIMSVKEIKLLNHEKTERKLLAIIDSVEDGIIAVNQNKEVEIFNRYCENLFNVNKEYIISKDIRKVLGNKIPILKMLEDGQRYDNVEVSIKVGNQNKHYVSTGRPVKDDNNKTIGVVASIKDIEEAIETANVITSGETGAFKEVIGNSLAIEKVKKLCLTIAKSNSTVLLRGESGTGKEVFAKSIQRLSMRSDKSFITVNCAALPDNLIESELFGYEKGSFTGARESGREGLFKIADGGTIFLDEIGELSLPLQAKLLRVLQEKTIRKVGSNKEEEIDVRVIAATNRNLEDMIKKEKFREDLYYRLNVIPIYIPPLRDRLEDIPMLVNYFINKMNKKIYKNIKGADRSFIEKLMKYNFPGNVRELQNIVERTMNLCNTKLLTKENLIIDFNDSSQALENIKEFEELELGLKYVVELAEREVIIKALNKHKSCRKAAKALKVSHTTVMNKLKKYNIECKE